ncbi:hypothetical protein HNQ64_003116 [Prosthecobacter dejongeii]|uniref:Uncharacterized protein n=1 Tax=Prosthecobacter dejongeii TaxID=48465 RepID=A0A7W7YMC8_9BACT|nr:hypothetical protein [Prosthecobacter dejongeii]
MSQKQGTAQNELAGVSDIRFGVVESVRGECVKSYCDENVAWKPLSSRQCTYPKDLARY